MLKNFLPFEKLVYRSTLTKEELTAHLENEIEAQKAFGFGARRHTYSKPYIGKVRDNRFEIQRAISYRNSFSPIIKGDIKNDINGCKINVRMNLEAFVQAFMIVWLGGVSLACIAALYKIIFDNDLESDAGFFIFIPFLMLVVGIVMVSLGFKVESKKSIQDLEEILKAKIVQS
ncbi:tetraspanin family protein [Flavobacterium sp. N1736]|uniref:tetraspanin family protein n=1 Tax=Flavobacterium sp. N1736 TaxID=2986823 RepID=UPI0022247BAF|nr:tetraspanin family protein [Flavobacterium sp. N1736]